MNPACGEFRRRDLRVIYKTIKCNNPRSMNGSALGRSPEQGERDTCALAPHVVQASGRWREWVLSLGQGSRSIQK